MRRIQEKWQGNMMPMLLTLLLCVHCGGYSGTARASARDRAKVRKPTTAEVTPSPSNVDRKIIIDIRNTPRPVDPSGTSYRTLKPEDLKQEVARLRRTLETTTAPETRRDLEDVLHLAELKLESGVDVQQLIDQISRDVFKVRHLDQKQPLRFRLLDREQMRKVIDQKIDRELAPDYLPNEEFVLKLLGALPEKTDLRKILLSMLTEQIAGLYDEDNKILYVVKEFDIQRVLGRIIIAHEICHAVQDQHFDIAKLPLNAPDNDDLGIAVSSVLEGDATIAMQDYARVAMGETDVTQLIDILKVDQTAYQRAPYFLKKQLTFPYLTGSKFLLKLTYANSVYRNTVFTNLPQSTEQILHPDKYMTADRDDPTSISLPDLSERLGAGWRRTFTNVLGEFQISLLFECLREWDQSVTASEGWDGDRFALYRNGDKYAFFWLSVWDTDEDAREFMTGISSLLQNRVYQERFGSGTGTTSDEILELSSPATADLKELNLRTRRADKAVLIEINSDISLLRKSTAWDRDLLKAANGAETGNTDNATTSSGDAR